VIQVLVRFLTATLASCALLATWACNAASGTPNNETNDKRLDSTVHYLQEAQNMDGGFGGNAGEPSEQDFSGWVALALAADGINPQDQAKPGGADVYAYLSAHAAQDLPKEFCQPIICTTAFERELLVVDAAGTSPRDFGGIDLVEELLARRLPDGSFPYVPGGKGEINDTVFAILGLSLVAEPAAQAALGPAAEWLIGQQNEDGGWAWHNKGSPSEADLTGAAIQALVAAKIQSPGATKALSEALTFLHKIQDPDGGFPELSSEHESNVASTAWATQGLWAVGENPETWTQTSGREPLDYMESMQQPDGQVRYRESEESDGVWMTAYVAPAFAGQPLPISAVPRAITPTAAPTQGPGVIAGGGGNGAPLFSRPQPQSSGETPGGVRLLDDKRWSERAARKRTLERHRNPGRPRKTPVPTTRIAAREGASSAHVGGGSGSAKTGTGRSPSTPDAAGGYASGKQVKGVLIAAAGPIATGGALEPGAPGLRSAASNDGRTSWLTVVIVAALLLAALLGAQIERRRPRTIP
jgi:prenyltransferase beta subunit